MDATLADKSGLLGSPSKLGSVKFDERSMLSSPTKFGAAIPVRK